MKLFMCFTSVLYYSLRKSVHDVQQYILLSLSQEKQSLKPAHLIPIYILLAKCQNKTHQNQTVPNTKYHYPHTFTNIKYPAVTDRVDFRALSLEANSFVKSGGENIEDSQ